MRFENAYPKSGLSPPSKNRGPQNDIFWRLHNLTATLTAYIFRTKDDIHNRASALQTARSLLLCLKTTWLWSTNRLKLDLNFYPPSVNCAFYFIASFGRRRSTNGTQPNFAKRWTVNALTICRRNVWVVPPNNNGAKPFTFVRFFDHFKT